MSATETKISNG